MGNVEMLRKLEQLTAIRSEREVLEEQEAALVDEIKAEMLSRGVDDLRVGTHHVKWTKYKTHRFDTKAFKADYEELYEKYEVEAESSRFSVK